jgi:hypothetical protein
MQVLAASALLAGVLALAQTQPVPQPFPRPGTPSRPAPSEPAPPPAQPPVVAAPAPAPGQPSPEALGLPVYPAAAYLTSYDAGQGQRYYLYGTNASYAEIVAYYRTYLKQRGNLVYDDPATHMFEVGRFREATMAHPPGITVKDYTSKGREGYLHVTPGAEPRRYRTIIQVVPAPSGG